MCVDSDIVRQMLLKDSTMSINSVPCFLLIFIDNYIEKYEGVDGKNG